LNWQRGLTASHDVAAGIASGRWTINGVRAQKIEADHTGSFIPVHGEFLITLQSACEKVRDNVFSIGIVSSSHAHQVEDYARAVSPKVLRECDTDCSSV